MYQPYFAVFFDYFKLFNFICVKGWKPVWYGKKAMLVIKGNN